MYLQSFLSTTYATAKICPLNMRNCNIEIEGLPLDNDLREIMSQPTKYSYDELSYIWGEWRNVTGNVKT